MVRFVVVQKLLHRKRDREGPLAGDLLIHRQSGRCCSPSDAVRRVLQPETQPPGQTCRIHSLHDSSSRSAEKEALNDGVCVNQRTSTVW